MVLLTKREVVNNMEFKSDFITFISSHSSTADTTIITGVYLDLVKHLLELLKVHHYHRCLLRFGEADDQRHGKQLPE